MPYPSIFCMLFPQQTSTTQVRTANTITPTGIAVYETEPIFTGNILEYNGTYYRIGEGHKEFIPDKAMDEDYYLLTLMAGAMDLNVFSIQEADVHLAAGLPLTWIRNQREEFRSYLLQIQKSATASTTRITTSALLDAAFIHRDTPQS